MSKREYCHTISQQYNCPRCLLIDLEQAYMELEELENNLESRDWIIDRLEAKLLIAVEALEGIQKASTKGDETTTELECHYCAGDALKKLRG